MIKSAEVVRKLKQEGWGFLRSKGSHHTYFKRGKGIVVTPHAKELSIGLLRKLETVTGVKLLP